MCPIHRVAHRYWHREMNLPYCWATKLIRAAHCMHSLTGSEGYQRWLEQREAKGRLAWWGALVCTTLFLVSAVASMGLSIKLHGVQEELKAARELADVCPISGNEFKVKEMESHVRELEVQVHRLLAEKSTQEAAVSNLNSEVKPPSQLPDEILATFFK